MPQPIRVVFVLLPDSLILDWAGPAEALRMANQRLAKQGLPPAFELMFAGPHADVRSSVGAQLSQVAPLPHDWSQPSWVVLVGQPGDHVDVTSAPARDVLHWLRGLKLEAGQLELVTICAGSLIAAHAGLLAGRQATTHHQHLAELKEIAATCDVVANRVFVLDGAVSSSAGVTTGIDLILHRIAMLCGEALAAQVAQTMVVAQRRGPADPELSPLLAWRNHLHPALHRVQDAISQNPRDEWSVSSMAGVACTSPRHLTRLFLAHAGIAPQQYLRRIRLAMAQTALEAGHNVTRAAELAGFNSDTQLRRAWKQFEQEGTPSAH